MNLNKFQRIQLVKQVGLNTENSILISSFEDFQKKRYFYKDKNLFSIRTMNNINDLQTVHYPVVTINELENIIKECLNKNLKIILADCVNPKYAEFVGCAMRLNDIFYIDLKHGAFTVRIVSREGKIDERLILNINEIGKIQNKKLKYCVEQFLLTNLNNVIFEFSWYKIPVGWKHENFICWEITKTGGKNEIK